MAEFKRRTLLLSSGKQIKLFGNSMAISPGLEIGEGYAPNVFSIIEQQQQAKQPAEIPKEQPGEKPQKSPAGSKTVTSISNPHGLTDADLMEIADYNMGLWLELKHNIRKHGVNNPRIFSRDI